MYMYIVDVYETSSTLETASIVCKRQDRKVHVHTYIVQSCIGIHMFIHVHVDTHTCKKLYMYVYNEHTCMYV